MVEDKEGRPRGYFLTSDRYDDKKKPLATALLAALFPELGIETWQRLKSYGEVEMLVSRDDMEKYGAVAYVEASALIEAARREVVALQRGGAPRDRKSVVSGKSVSVLVDCGVSRMIKKKNVKISEKTKLVRII